MFRMTVEDRFSAAHSIREYAGPCCRLHGHNYRVVVRLAGTHAEEGRALLRGTPLIPAETMQEAARKIVELAQSAS